MDNDQRARELLAAEYEREGSTKLAETIRSGSFDSQRASWDTALRAITAALTPDRGLREALERIDGLRPATCEMTLAHEMADIAEAALASQPAAPECTCQRYPTHCANDCPQHGLSEPTYTAGERVDLPPTASDGEGETPDNRRVSSEVLDRLRKIAKSGRLPGSNSNMMLSTYDAHVILAALDAEGADEAELAAFGASDPACYFYPGEGQMAERAAFCAGAAYAVSTPSQPAVHIGREEWQPIETAPHAISVMAARFDRDCGDWVYGVVLSPPSYPFTHWRPLPAPPAILRAGGEGV
jgi:hypothetical protein